MIGEGLRGRDLENPSRDHSFLGFLWLNFSQLVKEPENAMFIGVDSGIL